MNLRSLLRTNIKLTGNMKLALHTDVDSKGYNSDNNIVPAKLSIKDVYLEPLESILPTYNIKASLYSGSYEYDVKKFYDYYKDFFYTLNDDTKQNKINQYYISQSIDDNRKTNFEFGCKRISYEKNKYQFAFLAPIYFTDKESFPDTFVIKLKYKNIEKEINITLNKNELWNTYIQRYVSQINKKIIKLDVNTFNSYYFGIDAQHGGFIKVKDNVSKTLFTNELTINEFDNSITNSFMKNNIVISQILNLAFYFNIDESVFSDIKEEFDYFIPFEVSGYYLKNEQKVDFYDIDFDYEEEYINNYTALEEKYSNTQTNKNVFNLLGENTFIDFKYLCKQIPQINKWSLLNDEKYRVNLSESYSTNGGLYGLSLPFNDLLPSSVKISEGEYRYTFDWFEMPTKYLVNKLPNNIYDRSSELFNNYLLNFTESKSLSQVNENSVIYKGFQYTFSSDVNYNGYMFGIILVPVQTHINTNNYIEYNNDLIEVEKNGQKYIFYTIFLNLPVISNDINNTITISPKYLNDIYYNGMNIENNTNIFNIITPINTDINKKIIINNFKFNSIIFNEDQEKFFKINNNNSVLNSNTDFAYLKKSNINYITSLSNYYDTEVLNNFKNVLLLSFSNNISNNVLYIDYSNTTENDNKCHNIYYLKNNVVNKIQSLYFTNKKNEILNNDINEAKCLKRLLELNWIYAIDELAPNPEYDFKTYEDILFLSKNNTPSDNDENKMFINYIDLLLKNNNNLKFSWSYIKENILSNGLLMDNITKELADNLNSNSIILKTYYNILFNKNGLYLDYQLINDGSIIEPKYKNILYVSDLENNLPQSSNAPIWTNTNTYKIINTIINNDIFYIMNINIKTIPTAIKFTLLQLIPKYNKFTTYQPPYYIELQKRLRKIPIKINNKPNIKETDINIYKNSIYKIKLYRYMGFLMPKMYNVSNTNKYIGINNINKETNILYIKNYFQKKIKSTSNMLLSYTSQTNYLPVYESINEYTLYQNELKVQIGEEIKNEEIYPIYNTIRGININKYLGARIYDKFDTYTYLKPTEYKYFNNSLIYLLPKEIKIPKNELNNTLNSKVILNKYINENFNFLKLTTIDINYISNLYSYIEKKEYITSKLITNIIFTLK